jgi:hypothetical protein
LHPVFVETLGGSYCAVDAELAVGVVGFVVGAIGLAWGILRDIVARRERRRREELAAELQRPEVVVKMTAHGRESGGLERIRATVVVTNKGPTVARDARFGLRLYDEELPAGQVPVLGIDETHRASVFVPRKLEDRMQGGRARLEEAAYAWARFIDKHGRQREVSTI